MEEEQDKTKNETGNLNRTNDENVKEDQRNQEDLRLQTNYLADFFMKECNEKTKKEMEKVDFNFDLDKLIVTIKFEGKTVEEIENEEIKKKEECKKAGDQIYHTKRVLLKCVKKRLDKALMDVETSLKDKNMKHKVREQTIVLFRAQVLEQLLRYYHASDILESNLFKGTEYTKKKSKSKEGYVFILEVAEGFFSWDRVKTYLQHIKKKNSIKNFNRIIKFLTDNSTEYNSLELDEIKHHEKSILQSSSDSDSTDKKNQEVHENQDNINKSIDKKTAHENVNNKIPNSSDQNEGTPLLNRPQDKDAHLSFDSKNTHDKLRATREEHKMKLEKYEKLAKAYETVTENEHKALNLIAYYTVINAMSITSVIDSDFINQEDIVYEEDLLLEEECRPIFYENLLFKIFEDLKESNGYLYMSINLFLTNQKQLQKKNYEEIKAMKNEKERINALKDLMLLAFKRFLISFGMILCFTFELNTEFYVIDNQVHVEISCDYDSFLLLALSKTINLELELSTNGKSIIRQFTECRLQKKYKKKKTYDELKFNKEISIGKLDYERQKHMVVKELSQHIHVKYNPTVEELYKVYNEEDQEVELKLSEGAGFEENELFDEVMDTDINNQNEKAENEKGNIMNFMANTLKDETNNIVDTKQNQKILHSSPSNTSILRSVDRIRILSLTLDDLINFSELYESEIYYETKIKRYQHIYNKRNFIDLNYSIFNSEENKICVENYRNTYGESAGFYVAWTYHFLKWLIFLMAMMVVFVAASFLVSESSQFFFGVNLILSIEIFFILFFLLIWLNFYMFSWNTKETVLLTSWGNQSNAVERNREEYEPHLQFKLLTTKVYINSSIQQFNSYLLSIVVTLIMIAFTIYSLTYIQLMFEPIKVGHDKGLSMNKSSSQVINITSNSTHHDFNTSSRFVNNFFNTNTTQGKDELIPNSDGLIYPPVPFFCTNSHRIIYSVSL